MKAKIKATGEIINIADYARVVLDQCDSFGNPVELGFDEVEILQETTSDIDLEQVRIKAAIEVMKPLVGSMCPFIEDHKIQWAVSNSVKIADALIAELKKGGAQ